MIRPQYILQPVKTYFIVLSLVLAFLLNLLPWGKLVGVPDFVALVVLFWNIHQPRKVGMGTAFVLGLLMDVHNSNLLGEHALAYTLLSYGAITIHRRVLWMSTGTQILAVAPMLVGTQVISFVIRLLTGSPFPGWSTFASGFVEAALWPLVSLLLMMPQRRAINRDDTRPI